MIDQLVQSEFHLHTHPQTKKSYKDMAVPLSFRFRTLASVSNTDTIISPETEYPGSFEHYPKQALSGLFSYFFALVMSIFAQIS